MKALITGASGFIGQALTVRLRERGDEIVHFVRREPDPEAPVIEVLWDPADPDSVDAQELGAIDAVFNFSGATVARRWSRDYLKVIADSRIITTNTLVEICRRLESPPSVMVAASGIAVYGDRGDEQLTEASAPGKGILSEITMPWEAATDSASEFGVRTSSARFGIVISAQDGALPALMRPFKFGMGGRLGNGRQWTPWVHIDDAVSALLYIAENEQLAGAVNVVSPGVVRNRAMMDAIGDSLGKPSFGWMPAVIARIVIGNYIQELGLSSALVIPEKLMQAGFEFQHRDLRECLHYELAGTEKNEDV
jgi:uncharacterized protein (TIGR01777 family)